MGRTHQSRILILVLILLHFQFDDSLQQLGIEGAQLDHPSPHFEVFIGKCSLREPEYGHVIC